MRATVKTFFTDSLCLLGRHKIVGSVCRLVICTPVPSPMAWRADNDATNTTQLVTNNTNILVSLKVSDKENIVSKLQI